MGTPDTGGTTPGLDVHDIPGIGALIDTLQDLNIDHGTITEILHALGKGEKDMPREVRRPGQLSFGPLPKGVSLGYHSRLAHNYLDASVREMLETMNIFIDGVKAFRDGQNATDTYSADELRRINASTEWAAQVNKHQHRHHSGTQS